MYLSSSIVALLVFSSAAYSLAPRQSGDSIQMSKVFQEITNPDEIEKLEDDQAPRTLIFFYRDDCLVSKLFAPRLDDLVIQHGPSTLGYRTVNCQKHTDVCEKASVSVVPTVLIYPSRSFVPRDDEAIKKRLILESKS